MSSSGDQPPPASTSMGPPPQPSTSGAQLNVQTNAMLPPQHPGPMQSPHHPGPSSQSERYAPYQIYPPGKPMHRPPQQWPEGGQTVDPASNYPGYAPPGSVYGGQPYWPQQPRYMPPPQQYPGYGGYPPVGHYAPQPGDWRMPPPGQQMMYPQQPGPMIPGPQGQMQQPAQIPPQHQQPMPPMQTQPPQLPPPQVPQAPPPQAAPPSNQNVAAALQSPGATSSLGQEDSMDDTKSVRSTNSVPPPQTPNQRGSTATPSASTPGPSTTAAAPTPTTTKTKGDGTPSSKNPPPYNRQDALEKLVQTNVQITPELMANRRAFFERILTLAERNNEPMTAAPQVSKSPIDLHRLYMACQSAGGFERVTKEKTWKNLCAEANPEMSASSAAGYQLRRHYQKHLLQLECIDNQRSYDELVAFADKQKKKKKDKEPANAAGGSTTPAPAQVPPQMAPPQAQPQFQPHPGAPPQPGPSYPPVDANGQPMPPYGGPYGYPGAPPQAWGPPPQGYHPYAQPQHRFPGPGPRPPMDQASFEEHQRQQQMMYQNQMRPPTSVPVPAPGQPTMQQHQAPPVVVPPQAPQQPPPSNQSQQQQPQGQAQAQIPPPPASQSHLEAPNAGTPAPSTSRAPSAAPPVPQTQPPPQTAADRGPAPGPGQQPQTSHQSNQPNQYPAQHQQGPSDAPQMSMANQMGQPPMPYYQQPMGMYRMPGQYPPHGGPPNGYPQQPPVSSADPSQMQNPQGSMYGPPQGYPMHPQSQWNQQQMMRPPGPPNAYQAQQQEYWQRQAQQTPQPPRKPFIPQNQPPQASPGQQRSSQAAPQLPPMMPPPQQQQQQQRPQQARPPMPVPGVAGPPVPFQPPNSQHPPLHPAMQQLQPPQQHAFPPGTLESFPQHFLGVQRRPLKKTTRDLHGVTQKRMLMALRSDMHMETIWALNTLTVMLHDDGIQPIPLSAELLCLVMEHFNASLSLVFPKLFKLEELPDKCEFLQSANTDFWSEVIMETKTSGKEMKTKVKLVAPRPATSKVVDFNTVSRTGLNIKFENAEMPRRLKKWRPLGSKSNGEVKERITTAERNRQGIPSIFASRSAAAMKAAVEQQSAGKDKVRFSIFADDRIQHIEYDEDIQPKADGADEIDEEENGESTDRKPGKAFDRDAPLDCSLVPRPIGMFLIPKTIQDYTSICLAWSNVVRGFSFNPANESVLAQHNGLLRVIGKLLMLYVEKEGQSKLLSRKRKQEMDVLKAKDATATAEDDATVKKEEEKRRAAMVATEKDEMKSFLLDVANQLRDDAFSVLSVVAGSLNMLSLESDIAYPIYDALIHWTVSHSILSKDPLTPWGSISPRNFCLEILGKMTILEGNVDLLLATGSLQRMEEFIKVVSGLMHMGEDIPIREFALVITNAICQASELACVVAATETDLVKNTITFMEVADYAMNQIMQHHNGNIQYLRDNQDQMGTTFGMLRRACNLLFAIVRHDQCKKPFLKNMSSLINLTLSSYMDTRVANMVAEIMHTAYKANVDSETGINLDVPATPSVEPQILFPGKYAIPKVNTSAEDDDKKPDKGGKDKDKKPPKSEPMEVDPPTNGIKSSVHSHNHANNNPPSTSSSTVSTPSGQFQLLENGSGAYTNGINGHENEVKPPIPHHVNGVHKDVKAILRYSIHSKQHDENPNPAKKQRLDVNGTNGLPRINGSSPTSNTAASAGNSSSGSNVAIVT